MEFAFGDWKAVDGVVYPHRRVQEILGSGGGTTEAAAQRAPEAHAPMMSIVYRCESIAHGELAPAELAPPPDVAAAILDPKKRAPAPAADATKCTLEELEPQTVATVRVTIPANQVSATLAKILPEVMGALNEQSLQPSGPPFSRYHRIDAAKNEIDIEAGMPVRGAPQPSGRVRITELPGGKTAVTWHVGAYHELERSHERLRSWINGEKLAPRAAFWEVYWTDPSLEPDPSSWRTQILWPVE
jgi:effector-binding domain-containing protein